MFPELTPATYFIEMDPGLANAPGSRLADDLLSADWVILTVVLGRVARAEHLDGLRVRRAQRDHRPQFCQWSSYQDGLVRLYYRCR